LLLELRVENYAVLDHVEVEFSHGLNLLTGETGAGKSILIDALALLLGDRADSSVVRHGAERAVVSCVFEAEESPAEMAITKVLEENGIDSSKESLILRREIAANGKGRVFVNNQPATVNVLKQLAPFLAVIHAQNEAILAFDAAARQSLLDQFANHSTEKVTKAYTKQRDIRIRITELEQGEQDRLRLVDLWSFQKKEIAEANLQADEDEKLESEKRVLANAEKLYASAMSAYDGLYDGTTPAVASMRAAEKHLEELARYDTKFAEYVSQLAASRAVVEDVSTTLRDYADSIDASPERLAQIEDRLALLDRLKRKYGNTLDQVIAYGIEVARKLHEVEHRDEALDTLRKELAAAGTEYLAAARELSRKRHDAAKKLEKLVEAEINGLAMKAKFRIEVTGTDEEKDWGTSGFDTVAYLIATNAGEPMHPVEQIASGWELSRVMLALKASVMEAQSAVNGKATNGSKKKTSAQRTMVFDEVDTGIGGRAAEAVVKKLKSLARSTQVLCITHLPQIAALADHHLLIEKKETAGRTKTSVRQLTDSERTEEVARMLSGAKLTETSIKHAEQMIKMGN
jgi:DNA repair protein RecN (Recombination protein N)